jgi:hypothetical protein
MSDAVLLGPLLLMTSFGYVSVLMALWILSKELKFIIQVHMYVINVTDWMNIKCKIIVKPEGDILI